MDFFEARSDYMKKKRPDPADPLLLLDDELREALSLYWETAGRILEGSGTRLRPATESFYSLKNNFFSALFLYSYHRAGIRRERRVMYAAVNQCIRGMVTGCDNILDDEYKPTLDTDLPSGGTRFRSVLDIMVSDRVLFDIFHRATQDAKIDRKMALEATAVSLRALVRSGAQEAGEQSGITRILSPEEVLNDIHHLKTGLLFKSPWAIPDFLEALPPAIVTPMQNALYAIGIGCQVMDDMTDLADDLHNSRHNYIVSLIHHESGDKARQHLAELMAADRSSEGADLLSDFPEIRTLAAQKSRYFLETGLNALFETRHLFLVEPAITFLSERIGRGILRYSRQA